VRDHGRVDLGGDLLRELLSDGFRVCELGFEGVVARTIRALTARTIAAG
jgi:hypothetical protein